MKFCFHEESSILAEKTQSAGIANSLTGDTLHDSSEKSANQERMKNFILNIFLFLSFASGNSQNKDSICDLEQKNTQWKNDFISLNNLNDKIESLKWKINENSNYFESELTKETLGQYDILVRKSVTDKNGNNCQGRKMLFLVVYKKTKMKIVDLNQEPKWKSIIQKLNSENITKIEYLFDENSEKEYGMLGKAGTILIYLNDKKLEREINRTVM